MSDEHDAVENSGVTGMSRLRRATDEDSPKLAELLSLAFDVEIPAPAVTPEQNPLGAVIEGPGGEIEMAVLGRYTVFAVLTLLADPAEAKSENLKLLSEQIEASLRTDAHVDAVMFIVPRPLDPTLGNDLRRMKFTSEHFAALYWKAFHPGETLPTSTGRPS